MSETETKAVVMNHDYVKSAGVIYALIAAVVTAIAVGSVYANESSVNAKTAVETSEKNEDKIVELNMDIVEMNGKIQKIDLKTTFILEAIHRLEKAANDG